MNAKLPNDLDVLLPIMTTVCNINAWKKNGPFYLRFRKKDICVSFKLT